MNIVLNGAILAFSEVEALNPYLKSVRFILADDKPNLNNQGIPYTEFDNLAKSAIGMPIKIRFVGKRAGGAANHDGSIPVGHIVSVSEETADDGTHRLIASGALYSEEYPDIVEYLEEAFAANEAPGISWELAYHDTLMDKGIQWLKGVITRAATFVKNPAYGKRTALLAIAQDMTLTEDELDQILTILNKSETEVAWPDDTEEPDEGGTNTVDLEQALAKIKELEAQLQAEIDKSNKMMSESASRVSELEQAVSELNATIAAYEKAVLVADRTAMVVEAGLHLETDADALAKRQEFWASMTEDVFNTYVEDLKAMAKKTPATTQAEVKRPILALPRIAVDQSKAQTTTTDLREKMRTLSRTSEPAQTE